MTIWKIGLPQVRSSPCPPDASSYAEKFAGKYSHRIIKGGVAHNLPQDPQAFAEAVVEGAKLDRRWPAFALRTGVQSPSSPLLALLNVSIQANDLPVSGV